MLRPGGHNSCWEKLYCDGFSKPKIDGVVWRPAKRNQINFLEVSGFQRDKIHLQTKDNLEVEHFWQSLGFPGNDN
jgi:hypothetical protein